MWVEETKNGKFKFVERYTDYITGKQKKVSVTLDKNTPKSRKLAMEMLNKKIKTNAPIVQKETTLGELVEKYRVYQEKVVKGSTCIRNYYSTKAIADILGTDTLLSRINASYVMDCLINTDKSPTTLNGYLKRFRAMINWAYKNDIIDDISFLAKIENFKEEQTKRERIEDKFLEPNEVNTLIKNIQKRNCWHWYYLTQFLLLSGLRIGEAVALTLNDIDIDERIISVTKTYDFHTNRITSPKTRCSIREVYMQDELLELAKKSISYFKELKLLHEVNNDLLFTNLSGSRVEYYSFEKFLRENSRNIDKQVTAHILRHTHASLLLAEGVSVDTISRRLGHENSKITREIYLHVTEKLKQNDNLAIKNVKLL
jgi:integrase